VQKLQLLTRKTPDVIAPTPCPANSRDFGPVDYQIWGKLQECVYRSQVYDVALLKLHFVEVGIFQPDDQLIIDESLRQ